MLSRTIRLLAVYWEDRIKSAHLLKPLLVGIEWALSRKTPNPKRQRCVCGRVGGRDLFFLFFFFFFLGGGGWEGGFLSPLLPL